MLLLVGIAVSLIEIIDLRKEKNKKIYYFYICIILISVLLYVFRDDIQSINFYIEKIKGWFNGNS